MPLRTLSLLFYLFHLHFLFIFDFVQQYVRGNNAEPVYAQVNRERKKHPGGTDSTSSTQALLGSDTSNNYEVANNEPIYPPTSIPADDSWV